MSQKVDEKCCIYFIEADNRQCQKKANPAVGKFFCSQHDPRPLLDPKTYLSSKSRRAGKLAIPQDVTNALAVSRAEKKEGNQAPKRKDIFAKWLDGIGDGKVKIPIVSMQFVGELKSSKYRRFGWYTPDGSASGGSGPFIVPGVGLGAGGGASVEGKRRTGPGSGTAAAAVAAAAGSPPPIPAIPSTPPPIPTFKP